MRALKYFRALSHRLTHKPINMFITFSTNELYLQFINHSKDKKEVTHQRITRKLSQFIDQNQNKYNRKQFYRLLATQYNIELMNEIQQFNQQYLKKNFIRQDSIFQEHLQSLNQQIKHEYFKYYYLQIKHQKENDIKRQQNRKKILTVCEKIHDHNQHLASKIIDMMLGNQIIKSPTNIRKSIIQLINQNSKTIPQFIIQNFLSFYDPSKLNFINNQQQKRFINGGTYFYSNTFNPTVMSCSIIQRINAHTEINLVLLGDKNIGKSFSLFHYRWLSQYLPCQGQKLKFLYFADFTEALSPLTTAKIIFDQYYRDLPKYVLFFIKDICLKFSNILPKFQIKHQATKQTKFTLLKSIKLSQEELSKINLIQQILDQVLGNKVKYLQQKKTFEFQTKLTQMQTLRILINFIRLYNKNFLTTITCFDQFNELTNKGFLKKKKNQNNVINFIGLFLPSNKIVVSTSSQIDIDQPQNLLSKILPLTQLNTDKTKQFVIYELKKQNYHQVNQFEREKTFNILRKYNKNQQELKAIKDIIQKQNQMIVNTLQSYNLPFNCQDIRQLNQAILAQCLKISHLQFKSKLIQQNIKIQLNKARKKTFKRIIDQLQIWIKNYYDKTSTIQIINQRYKTVLQIIFRKQQEHWLGLYFLKQIPFTIYNKQNKSVHQFVRQHKIQIFFQLQRVLIGPIIQINRQQFVVNDERLFAQYVRYFFYFNIDQIKYKIFDVFPIQNIFRYFQKCSIYMNFNRDNKKLAQYINCMITHINQPYIFQICKHQTKIDIILAIVLLEGQQRQRSIKQVQNMKQQLKLEICFVEIGLDQGQKLEQLVKQCQSGLLEGLQMQKWQQGKDNQRIYKYSQINQKYMLAFFNKKNKKYQYKKLQYDKLNKIINKRRQQLQKNNKNINQQQLKIQSEKELKEQQRIKIIIKYCGYVKNVQTIYCEEFQKYAKSFKLLHSKKKGKNSKKQSK